MRRFDNTLTLEAPNSETLAKLEEQVLSQLSGRLRDFRLLLHEGRLILKGRAPTYHAKQLAQHAVMAAADLPIHANDIEVV